ncbi:hypothetical protein [Streptomyces sp. AA4]|uniref:hypothetical protein n=1 Tax=Streptomyces sp. AA4 TaxID=591158 RepID=UPI0001DEE264|nr:hypothetical protein [Streptomyces sp. AA4]EFL06821.1 hypothetical protein SSMG_02492 [Streptomyces sp. AA4]
MGRAASPCARQPEQDRSVRDDDREVPEGIPEADQAATLGARRRTLTWPWAVPSSRGGPRHSAHRNPFTTIRSVLTAPQRWRRPATTVAALAAATLGATIASAGQDEPTPGTDGAGDSCYPQDGNGGYDVSDYDLKVSYAPDSRQLTGLQTVNARATQPLSSFNLDLRGLTVDSVKVNGLPAQFSRTGDHELVITPRNSLVCGLRFSAGIAYHGVPTTMPGSNGWQHIRPGGAFAAGRPQSAMTWYPANETPRDKARFRLAVTVPDE